MKMLPVTRLMPRLASAAVLALSLTTLMGCDDDAEGGEAAKATDTEATPADDAEEEAEAPPVPTDAELQKEAESAVTADNADAIADALAKELEAELAE